MTGSSLLLIGRILLASYFVASGVRHFWVFPEVAGMMRERGVPSAPAALGIGTAFEIVGGLMLAAGLFTVAVCLALIAFSLVASVIAMDFWNQEGPQRGAAINGWLANVAVIGGLLVVAAGALT